MNVDRNTADILFILISLELIRRGKQMNNRKCSTADASENLSHMSLEDNVTIYSSSSHNVSIFQKMEICVKLHPHSY